MSDGGAKETEKKGDVVVKIDVEKTVSSDVGATTDVEVNWVVGVTEKIVVGVA